MSHEENINKKWMQGRKDHLELRRRCACVLLEFLRALKPIIGVRKVWLVHKNDRCPSYRPDYPPEEALYPDGQDERPHDSSAPMTASMSSDVIRAAEGIQKANRVAAEGTETQFGKTSFRVLIGLVLEGAADEHPSELLMLPARISVFFELQSENCEPNFNRALLQVLDETLELFIPLPLLGPVEGQALYDAEKERLKLSSSQRKKENRVSQSLPSSDDFAQKLRDAAKKHQKLVSIPQRYRNRSKEGLEYAATFLERDAAMADPSRSKARPCTLVLQGRGGPGLEQFAHDVTQKLLVVVRDPDFIWKARAPREPKPDGLPPRKTETSPDLEFKPFFYPS